MSLVQVSTHVQFYPDRIRAEIGDMDPVDTLDPSLKNFLSSFFILIQSVAKNWIMKIMFFVWNIGENSSFSKPRY